ncbi:MAG: DUF4178 domain-containing protein [Pseudomonadota bacterium]
MSQQIRCPNCGADHNLGNPGITMLVCQYCKTTVYWGEDQKLKIGAKSILPETDSRLYMHATGSLYGRGYQVIGHMRYDHGRGAWDEWYLEMNDGTVAWVSEDERKLTLEESVHPDNELPVSSEIIVGMEISLDGISYSIRETGTATCIGGEGQLPFTILPGEQYSYADLASLDGEKFATLEYDQDGQPSTFAGQTLSHDDFQIDDERPPSTSSPKEGSHIKCANCGGSLEITGEREVQTRVCEYCGAQLDLTQTEAHVLGINPEDFDPQFSFEIGQAGTFLGDRYEVCGRMLYHDNEAYPSREYLLFNPDKGYLWLAEENNHYVLNSPTQQAPSREPFGLGPKFAVTIGNTRFRLFESGVSTLVYVDGALPWLAQSGDVSRYADLIAPPYMFSAESDGKEIEYFLGHYMSSTDVWTAFDKEESPPPGIGIHPAQPFIRSRTTVLLMTIGSLFALLNLGLLFWSTGQPGHVIFHQKFSPDQYSKETISDAFQIGEGKIIEMDISASLDNSWLAVDVALLDNAKKHVVAETNSDVSFYYGYEDGEAWSEGGHSASTYFLAPPPGTYRLLLKVSGGSGKNNGPPRGEELKIMLFQGVVLSRYFLMAFIITALFPSFEMLRKYLFGKRRWAPVTEDDDEEESVFDWD